MKTEIYYELFQKSKEIKDTKYMEPDILFTTFRFLIETKVPRSFIRYSLKRIIT